MDAYIIHTICIKYHKMNLNHLHIYYIRESSQNPCKAFSIRVTSADMDVYVLLQWRKAGVRFAKGLNTIIYRPISKRKPDHNLMSRFCWGAKGRERFAKARRFRAFSGTIILDNPHIYIHIYIYTCAKDSYEGLDAIGGCSIAMLHSQSGVASHLGVSENRLRRSIYRIYQLKT